MAKSLIRSNQLSPDISGLVGAYGSGFFPPLSSVDDLVYTTGDQTIAGIKTFEVRPTVTGLSVLLSGEYAAVPPNIVYASGAQTISGLKTFYLRPEVNGSGVVLTGDGVLYSGDREPMKIVSTDADFVFSTGDFYIMRGGFNLRSGVLPVATHGKSYYVRSNRLYDLVLAATGSEKVDYSATKILTSGQGAHLIGVVENFPGQGYTGWQTV